MCDAETGRQVPCALNAAAGSQWNIKNLATPLAHEVSVLTEIRTKPRCIAFHIDLFGEAAVHQGFEAIIDRRQRDGGYPLLCAQENFRGCRVISLGKKYFIHFATLRREAMTVVADRLFVAGVSLRDGFHFASTYVRQILNQELF
jgi:hypothetical protein